MSDADGRGEILEDRDVEARSSALAGKRVLLVVAGGIAAVTTPQLCRELRRHGAIVETAMTPAAEAFLGSLCLEWASGSPVLTGLTGRAEQTFAHDLVLVAPATLDLVGKMAVGIADNAALTSIASAFGRRTPVILCPTMHQTLWANPLFQENLERLSSRGLATVVPPLTEEAKAKMPPVQQILRHVRRALTTSPLRGKSILLTAGPTRAAIDDVRFIENRSSGRAGCQLAEELDARGADVLLIYGPGAATPPAGVEVVPVESPDEMLAEVLRLRRERQPVAGIFAAAVLDFVPERPVQGKIPSSGELTVRFRSTPKIIERVDGGDDSAWVKVGFKLQAGVSDAELLQQGQSLLERARCQFVVCNHIEQVSVQSHRAALLTASGVEWVAGREALVSAICDALETLVFNLLP